MKKQILTLVIGILLGAIIATGVFLVLQSNSSNTGNSGMEMRSDDGMRGNFDSNSVGEMPDGEAPDDLGNLETTEE